MAGPIPVFEGIGSRSDAQTTRWENGGARSTFDVETEEVDDGNEPDTASISDRGLFRLLAGKLARSILGLLQQNLTQTDETGCVALCLMRASCAREALVGGLCGCHCGFAANWRT
jgi:hypothetical protein